MPLQVLDPNVLVGLLFYAVLAIALMVLIVLNKNKESYMIAN